MIETQIKYMVDRFLCWRLPENFNPDAGISFQKTFNEHTAHPAKHEPTGTNLFDAQQATEMVRHLVDGLPGPGVDQSIDNEGWEWCFLEIMGHRSHWGRSREEERFGAKMIRIDIPLHNDPVKKWDTHYYNGASIFSYSLTDEATVMKRTKPYEPPSRIALSAPETGDDEDMPF